MKYLEGLNERQREAALYTEGPLLIIAGAGAGKTRVIVHRILHLIHQGALPEKILAVTFTNKAAREMRGRIFELLAAETSLSADFKTANDAWQTANSPWVGTFHALGVQIIRAEHQALGLARRFTIFDRSDSLSALKSAMKESGLDPKSFEPGKILSVISREKGNLTDGAAFAAKADGYYPELVARAWDKYEAILRRENALDFDDLLLKPVLLLKHDQGVLARLKRLFSHIHIDEYQDINRAQYELVRLLAGEAKNVAAVGDADQNIYSWRGASVKNILDFERDYPGAKTIVLEENYRSTKTILAAANRIIARNELRREKNLFTQNPPGEKLGLYAACDEGDEARFAAGRARRLIENGAAPREVAVLFRANFQSRTFEEAFLESGVPYQVVGVRFFERKEVKDALAYVRLARTDFARQQAREGLPSESLSDIKRAINVPPRGIGKVSLLKILAGREEALPAKMRESLKMFRRALAEMGRTLEEKPLPEALKFALKRSGIEEHLKKGSGDDLERLENLRELVTFSLRYRGLPPREAVERFLTDAALAGEQDELSEERDAVRLMTAHAAKGLEFDYVFITGLEQDLFPHAPPARERDESRERAEEERRLFYVALTRAKKKLFLSYASVRTVFGSRQIGVPSEFISDVPEELLDPEEPPEGGGKTIYF